MFGTIKKVVPLKGYGFIRPEGAVIDMFFHAVAVDDPYYRFSDLREGMKVSFDVYDDNRRNQQRAVNIKVLSSIGFGIQNEAQIQNMRVVWIDLPQLQADCVVKIVAVVEGVTGNWTSAIGAVCSNKSEGMDDIALDAWDAYDYGFVFPENIARMFFPDILTTYIDD